ncbi:ABC transporter ATP-binding protein [Candidatus Saccharibacteria bacterium]|nr:ABC transporter ATP-binding protein [Candidatus Saccharibacteria bacterium]MBP9552264.1 ABC transporter ATP-binding protein [Candidatus Saccharibacteria bacterium]
MSELIVKNLRHTYTDGGTETEVLKGIDAKFESGKMYAIVGESGSGKSTLISLLSGLDKIQSGEVLLNGESAKEIGEQKYRLGHVNIVFQAFNLIKYMTARENVEVAIDFLNDSQGDIKERAYKLLEAVGIDRQKADRLVNNLSGGEQQRAAIARCMVGDVPVIIADEPTGNLDEKTEEKILQIFHQLAEDGKIVIIVTHSKKVAEHAHAEVWRMKGGVLTKK